MYNNPYTKGVRFLTQTKNEVLTAMNAREELGNIIEELLNEAKDREINVRKIVEEALVKEIRASKMDMHIDYINGRVETCDCCGAGKTEEEEYWEGQQILNDSYARNEYGLDTED